MNKSIPRGQFRGLAEVLVAGFLSIATLSGCADITASEKAVPVTISRSAEIEKMLSRMVSRNDLERTVKQGLVELSHGNYEEAGDAFRAGLRMEPGNGHLHFLNALTYHLRGQSGDMKMLELAQAGYLTALKFDESNHLAAYLLGQIYFRKREYVDAQNQFAYGLLYAPEDPHLLNALAAASYYSRDPSTAIWASRKAYALAPENPASIRNVMFAEAAIGQFDDTPRLVQAYHAAALGQVGSNDPYWVDMRVEQASSRLQDWKKFYVAAGESIFGKPSSDIVTYGNGGSGDTADADRSDAFSDGDSAADGGSTGTASVPARVAAKSGRTLPKMTNIDVVIIRTEEVRSQARGINILDGLKTTLSGTLFEYNYTHSSGSTTTTHTVNPRLGLGGLEYNLNIFNDQKNKAEVLARPSLLATEKVTSKFFSGGVLHVQLSSNIYDGGLEDIDIGISLSVTPEFLDADTLSIDVQADHEFLEMQDDQVGFTSFSQTTKTSVQAKAVLRFDETLILSGLSLREDDKSESGVPILQDIPGVQYLFSRDEALETKTSILILLTPRKPRYSSDELTEAEFDRETDLDKVYTDKLKTTQKIRNTNLNAALAHLGRDSQFYRQFRTGDIELRFFEDDDSVFGAIKRTLGFLYY